MYLHTPRWLDAAMSAASGASAAMICLYWHLHPIASVGVGLAWGAALYAGMEYGREEQS